MSDQEMNFAKHEAACNYAIDQWFSARPNVPMNRSAERIFEGGFRLGMAAQRESSKPIEENTDSFVNELLNQLEYAKQKIAELESRQPVLLGRFHGNDRGAFFPLPENAPKAFKVFELYHYQPADKCNYPDCNCPFDRVDGDTCLRGLPE